MQIRTFLSLSASIVSLSMQGETLAEVIRDTTEINEVVVTGSRNEMLSRDLPTTVSVIGHEKLNENFEAIIVALMKAKPATAKGTYILSCTISGTMTPGVKINTKDLARAAK